MTTARAHVEAARRLLAHESAGSSAEECAAAAVRVYEKLSRRLAPLIGNVGVQALFVRSAKLSARDFPCLGRLFVDSVTPEAQLQACLGALEPAAATDAAAAMVGTFLGLLTAFIGEPIVWQVLEGTFPATDLKVPKEAKS